MSIAALAIRLCGNCRQVRWSELRHAGHGALRDGGSTRHTHVWGRLMVVHSCAMMKLYTSIHWLVVWNMNGLWLSIYWEFHHPNRRIFKCKHGDVTNIKRGSNRKKKQSERRLNQEKYGIYIMVIYPLVNEEFANLKMAIEIVDLTIKKGDFPVRYFGQFTRGSFSIQLGMNHNPIIPTKSAKFFSGLGGSTSGDYPLVI